jgi:hypothetical protein
LTFFSSRRLLTAHHAEARIRLLACLLVHLATILVSSVGRGDEADDPRSRAVRLTTEGSAAYKAEDYPRAIEKFSAAYRLYAAAPLLLNLSRAELKLNRCAEAIRYAEMFKAAVPDMPAVSPDSPDEWLGTIQRSCIEARVDSTPQGATIWIDGERQTSPDRTPWKGRLPVGTHKILLWRDDYQEQGASLEVTANAPAHLSIRLNSATGTDAPPPGGTPRPAPPETQRPSQTPAVASGSPPGTLPVRLLPQDSSARESLISTHARSQPALRNIGYAGIAAGGAALVAALALGITVMNDNAALGNRSGARTTAQANAELSSLHSREEGADALFGIGGLLAAGGVALAVVF